jgi:hypothetical protein
MMTSSRGLDRGGAELGRVGVGKYALESTHRGAGDRGNNNIFTH